MKQNETIMDSWILFSVSGWFIKAQNSGAQRDGQIWSFFELWGCQAPLTGKTDQLLLGSVDFQIPIGESLMAYGISEASKNSFKSN